MPNVTVTVKLNGMDEALDKVHELVEAIKKAKSLADDLTLALDGLHAEEQSTRR